MLTDLELLIKFNKLKTGQEKEMSATQIADQRLSESL